MFRYILAMVILLGVLSFPLKAQDSKNLVSTPDADVASITTFSILVVNFVEKGAAVVSVRVQEDGTASCRHIDTSGDEAFSKTVTTEVDAKLTALEIKSIREVFARLELDTLKTRELKDGEEPPTKFVVMQATNGTAMARFACEADGGEYASKVKPFVKVITKLAERLK